MKYGIPALLSLLVVAVACSDEEAQQPVGPENRTLFAAAEHCDPPTGPTTVINTLSDDSPGSLKAAVTYVNANIDPANPKLIDFCVENNGANTYDPQTGVFTIELTSALGVRSAVIDGTTQPGYTDRPLIEIVGPLPATVTTAIALIGAGAGVRGLIINRIGRPIGVGPFVGGDAPNFVIEKNWIGLDKTGEFIVGPLSGNVHGILVGNDSDGGRIAENVISITGSAITLGNSHNVEMRENRIGVDPTGARFVCQNSVTDCTGEVGTIGGIGELTNSDGSGHVIINNQIVVRGGGVGLAGSGGGNLVQGNKIGVDAAMTAMLAADFVPNLEGQGIVMASDNNAVRDNVIVVRQFGINLGPDNQGNQPENNDIVGNFIGLNASGDPLQAPGTGRWGVLVGNATGTLAPSNTTIRDNWICCQFQGMVIRGDPAFPVGMPSGYRFEGNTVETSTREAVLVSHVAAPNEFIGNTLKDNEFSGGRVIGLIGDSGPFAMRGNMIYDNLGIGIDLGNDGITANDLAPACDEDTGANLFQNFPEITLAGSGAGITVIQGELRSAPNETFEIELFANDTDKREGRSPLDPDPLSPGISQSVTTDASCEAHFSVLISPGISQGQYVTATAADASGNTSEFSIPMLVTNLTLEGQIDATFALIDDLVANGELAKGPANGLRGKLRDVARQVEKGHGDDALGTIGDFITQVKDLFANGQISEDGADALLSAAEAIQLLISG